MSFLGDGWYFIGQLCCHAVSGVILSFCDKGLLHFKQIVVEIVKHSLFKNFNLRNMFIPRQLNKSLNAKDRNRNDKQKNYRGTENDKYLSFFNILFHVCKQDGRLLGLARVALQSKTKISPCKNF